MFRDVHPIRQFVNSAEHLDSLRLVPARTFVRREHVLL